MKRGHRHQSPTIVLMTVSHVSPLNFPKSLRRLPLSSMAHARVKIYPVPSFHQRSALTNSPITNRRSAIKIILTANYPVVQMEQQLAQILGQIQQTLQQIQQIQQTLIAIRADMRELRELTTARYTNPLFPYNLKIMCFLYRDFNNHVRFTHARIFRATDSLITMRSVDTTANAPVQLNTLISNFPPTANAVTQLTGTVYT